MNILSFSCETQIRGLTQRTLPPPLPAVNKLRGSESMAASYSGEGRCGESTVARGNMKLDGVMGCVYWSEVRCVLLQVEPHNMAHMSRR